MSITQVKEIVATPVFVDQNINSIYHTITNRKSVRSYLKTEVRKELLKKLLMAAIHVFIH